VLKQRHAEEAVQFCAKLVVFQGAGVEAAVCAAASAFEEKGAGEEGLAVRVIAEEGGEEGGIARRGVG